MIYICTFLSLIFSFIGIGLLLSDMYPLPSRATRSAVLMYHGKKKRTVSLKELSEPLAKKIQQWIRIGKYKRDRLEKTLHAASIEDSPELYIARALASAIMLGIFLVPLSLLVHPVLAVASLILSILMYQKQVKQASKEVEIKRQHIQIELPHLASTIAEELKRSRDVSGILNAYSKTCGKELKKEIDITLADMHIGNQREALGRLSVRVPSLGLSQIVRGLQSVLDGNDQHIYFQIISQTLENEQDQYIERHIQTLYNKIKPYSMLLLFCMVLLILVTAGIHMYKLIIQM